MRMKTGLICSLLLLFFMSLSMTQAVAGVSPPMIIEPIETGIAGSASNIMVKNATPNFPNSAGGVEYFFSFNPGATGPISAYCTDTGIDLANARFLGRRPTNSDGISSFVANVPVNFEGVTVYIQALDTSDCDKSSVVSLTFEPPIQEFDLFLNPLVPGTAGHFNIFSTNFATPGGFVKYRWGLAPGVQNGNALCPGFIADIPNFKDIGNLPVDDFGNTLGGFFVPHAAAGLTIYVQGVDLTTCAKSNVLANGF